MRMLGAVTTNMNEISTVVTTSLLISDQVAIPAATAAGFRRSIVSVYAAIHVANTMPFPAAARTTMTTSWRYSMWAFVVIAAIKAAPTPLTTHPTAMNGLRTRIRSDATPLETMAIAVTAQYQLARPFARLPE